MSEHSGFVFSDPDLDPSERERLYPELGRANLLRLRGDYDGAIHQCLSVLKRMPDDLSAHILVADIYAESGDLHQASQWYELGLEIDPRNKGILQKLENVRERSSHREIAETAEQLGLPPDSPKLGWVAGGVISFVFLIAIASFVLGQRNSNLGVDKVLHVPITAPTKLGDGTPDPSKVADAKNPKIEDLIPHSSNANSLGSFAQEDRTLTVTLSERTPLGSHIASASEDPRTKIVTITYTLRSDEDARKIGAELAKATLEQVTDSMTVTLRGIRDEKLSYVADVSRDNINSANQAAGNQPDTSSEAWLSKVLTSEWNAQSGNASTASASPSPTGASSGEPNSATGNQPPTTGN